MIDVPNATNASSPRAGGFGGADAEAVNRWLLGVIAAAWRAYPSAVELAYADIADNHVLAGAVIDRLAQQGVVQLRGDGLALSETGYASVDKAARSDGRFSDVLRAGALPQLRGGSSLVLAILRAHFELHGGSERR